MAARRDVTGLGRLDAWDGVRVVVAGFDTSGFAVADNLTHLGAEVLALDESEGDADRRGRAELLEVLGAQVRLGPGSTATLPVDVDLVVTSPGWSPQAPLLREAAGRGLPVWGEVELAWRLRHPEHDTPWLVVTGGPGATRTVRMLDAVLRAAGLRSQATGAAGMPVLEAVMDPLAHDVLAVGLTAGQLRWVRSTSPQAAAVLGVPLPPPGGEDPTTYAAHLGRAYHQVRLACVYDVADPATEELVVEAEVVEGARAIGTTLGMPAVGMLGLVEDILVDRAFIPERATSAAELCTLADLAAGGWHDPADLPAAADRPDLSPDLPPDLLDAGGDQDGQDEEPSPVLVRNALAAAALARAHGVSQAAVRDGLRARA